jgi:hypothetical protein
MDGSSGIGFAIAENASLELPEAHGAQPSF